MADRLHDEWRASRRLPGGGYAARVKKTGDQRWITSHGTDQVDIANTRYQDLPADWQRETRESADLAVGLVRDSWLRGVDPRSEEFIESASSRVHDAWLRRNGAWAPPEQRLPYAELAEEEKAKDRAFVLMALDLFE
ncbi:hypothetical protein [Actinoallomurus acaciae]|uniref:Uncharacterized protein n=1 Tax=Actinoallomurus acaciae TaxID=502577 RepID=A0ABV5YF81_9ACTN